MNKSKLYIVFILIFLGAFGLSAIAQKVTGTIVDSRDGEPLPLVNIVYNKANKLGTTTNYNGYFEIPSLSAIANEIQISFIGYKTLTISKDKIPKKSKKWVIELEPSLSALDEIDLVAKENPALRIIRNAIGNRKTNNPKNYDSYTYTSYNKDIVTYKAIDVTDTLTIQDSLRAEKDEQAALSRHLLIFESVTKKFYKAPNKSTEKVIGTKISGFKDPEMGTVPEGFQNFGFYDNTIPLLGKNYLNPISENGDKRYIFILKDTTFSGSDTTFIMDYLPDIGANFEGFIGEIHINSNQWAIEYIYAFPNDTGKINVILEQRYSLINNEYWFPSELNFNYVLEKFPFRQTGAYLSGKSFIDSVRINIPIDDSVFSLLRVEFVEGAGRKSEDFWSDHRAENLDIKEQSTYQHMDSLGARYNFDAILYSTHNLYNGFVSFKKFDLQFNKFIAFNSYEGWRLGLGIYTNKYLSKDFKIGGYFGHGSRDGVWKYGGTAKFYYKKNPDNNLELNYKNDLRPPGLIDVRYWKFFGGFREQFFSTFMDSYEEYSAYINMRFSDFLETKIGFKNFRLKPNYDYEFTPVATGGDPTSIIYGFAESYVKLRWVHKEIFKNNFGQRISEGSKYPVLFLSWAHGFNNVGWGNFEYNKLEFGITWEHYFSGLGETDVTLEAGLIDNSVPYAINFNSRPSYKPGFAVVLPNTYQTMRLNEFTSSQYASLFLKHNLKSLLFRKGNFKPEVILMQGISYGTLINKENHKGIVEAAKTMEKGFFESGIVLDNLIRLNTFNVGYIGIGAGAFYRYGAYQLPDPIGNWAFKFSFLYSIN